MLYDVLIVGGGPIGMSLALALADTSLQVGIIEQTSPGVRTQPNYDTRSLAIAHGSAQIFAQLGCWDDMKLRATPIVNVHISDRGHFGFTRLEAKEFGVPAVGYIVEMPDLLATLWKGVGALNHCRVMSQATVKQVTPTDTGWSLVCETPEGTQSLEGKLLIAADGGRSSTRDLLGVKVDSFNYQQQAIIANVSLGRPHQGVAYERFTSQGPMALLPMTDQRASLVYTVPADAVEEMMALSDEQFLQRLQLGFGYRLGRFLRVGKRSTFPLCHLQAKQQIQKGAVVLGNAAHTLHPVAGQGFNLGLRDVICLAGVLRQAWQSSESLGDMSVLQRYLEGRIADQKQTMQLTEGLVHLFSYDFLPITFARNLGMIALDATPWAKRWFARRGMGLAANLPYERQAL